MWMLKEIQKGMVPLTLKNIDHYLTRTFQFVQSDTPYFDYSKALSMRFKREKNIYDEMLMKR